MQSVDYSSAFDPERIFLSRADVDRLIEDNSIDSRIDVVKKISQKYVEGQFSVGELQYAEQIFRQLVRDTEMRVRRTLAQYLREAETMPRDIIISLANDREAVAVPIIESSNILSDADLIRIIENSHEIGKIEAVAGRSSVSERVSHTLIETHYPQVVTRLLDNANARINGKDYDMILSDHASNPHIAEQVARRPNLPLPVVERVIHLVSDQIAEELKQHYNITFEKASQQTQESMLLQLTPYQGSEEEIEETLQQMMQFDRLTPSIMVHALCLGHLTFFEIALAKLARIPKANARKLIRDRGNLGFSALYEKAQLPDSLFDAVKLLLESVLALIPRSELSPGTPAYTSVLMEEMLRRLSETPVENGDYMVGLVRQSLAQQQTYS